MCIKNVEIKSDQPQIIYSKKAPYDDGAFNNVLTPVFRSLFKKGSKTTGIVVRDRKK